MTRIEAQMMAQEQEARAIVAETMIKAERMAKYRMVPVPFHQDSWSGLGEGEQQKRCARRTGHVLTITDAGIKCSNCGALWRNEGF